MFYLVITLLSLVLVVSPLPIYNDTLIAKLGYGTFRGAYSSTYNLNYFRKIPFAAPTTGCNRFRAPQPPILITNGTFNSDQAFDMCPQRTTNGSEDCLYLGVYSRPWTPSQPLRPVLLTFYGGGFVQGSATFNIPPPGFPILNASQLNDYIVVYSNYRTNVFGFLSGRKIQESAETELNTGLLDQRAALEWIQSYIHIFGGDKSNVTIWGQSAGGGSVIAQAIAQGNKEKKLFSKAMASSPFWPKTYRYDSPENEEIYEAVVTQVGCKGEEDEIACLKSVDVQTLRDVSLPLTTSHQYTTSTFTWGPVIDDNFLFTPLSDIVKNGDLNADMVLTSYNLHEGENFIPPGFSSLAGSGGFNASTTSFYGWLQGFLPGLDGEELEEVKRLYPVVGTAEEINWNATYERAGLLYRDLILACPAYWLAAKASKGYLAEYTISPAKHASDTIYWNTLNPVQQSDRLIYEGYTGAMASFIQTGDPNAHKITNASVADVPEAKDGKQFVVRNNAARIDEGGIGMLEGRCEFWLGVAGKVPM